MCGWLVPLGSIRWAIGVSRHDIKHMPTQAPELWVPGSHHVRQKPTHISCTICTGSVMCHNVRYFQATCLVLGVLDARFRFKSEKF
jgi:hypothetical protein